MEECKLTQLVCSVVLLDAGGTEAGQSGYGLDTAGEECMLQA
jgi:hypothetical protein